MAAAGEADAIPIGTPARESASKTAETSGKRRSVRPAVSDASPGATTRAASKLSQLPFQRVESRSKMATDGLQDAISAGRSTVEWLASPPLALEEEGSVGGLRCSRQGGSIHKIKLTQASTQTAHRWVLKKSLQI